MSELETAREQLEQAISRLEQALATRGDDAALERALADARAETKNLRQVADTVSGRLDAAIGRLKSTLETGA